MPPKKSEDEDLKNGSDDVGQGSKPDTEGGAPPEGGPDADGNSSRASAMPSDEAPSDGTLQNEGGGRDRDGRFYVTVHGMNFYAEDVAGVHDAMLQERNRRAGPERRPFELLGNVHHDNRNREEGETVHLTQADHAELAELKLVYPPKWDDAE